MASFYILDFELISASLYVNGISSLNDSESIDHYQVSSEATWLT